MCKSIAVEKAFQFAKCIVILTKKVKEEKKESVMTKQLLRAATSVAANLTESQNSQSRADFISKVSIANKENSESAYWLRLLFETYYLGKDEYEKLIKEANELRAIMTKMISTAKKNLQKIEK